MPAGVFYCKDAFEGLDVMDALIDPTSGPPLLEQIRHEAEMELDRAATAPPAAATDSGAQPFRRPTIIPRPPTWGPRVVRQMPLDVVFQHLAKNELFRLSWGAKNTHGEAWENSGRI